MNAFANQNILTQGNVQVSMDDIDGFAYKIPEDRRAGFFSSPERIEKTLFTILNMKHIKIYGSEKNLIDTNLIDLKASERLQQIFPMADSNFNMFNENKIKQVLAFLKLEQAYIQVQQSIADGVKDEDLEELANEKYMVNKAVFKQPASRSFDYISFLYNSTNKQEQLLNAQKALDSLITKTISFKELQLEYIGKDANIEVSSLNNFKFDKVNKDFSTQIFAIKEKGVAANLIDFNGRYSIIKMNKITPAKQLSFAEVKDKMIADLRQKGAERAFNSLLISLTQDKVQVNESEDFITLLKNRYK